jgi:hypothetical protein
MTSCLSMRERIVESSSFAVSSYDAKRQSVKKNLTTELFTAYAGADAVGYARPLSPGDEGGPGRWRRVPASPRSGVRSTSQDFRDYGRTNGSIMTAYGLLWNPDGLRHGVGRRAVDAARREVEGRRPLSRLFESGHDLVPAPGAVPRAMDQDEVLPVPPTSGRSDGTCRRGSGRDTDGPRRRQPQGSAGATAFDPPWRSAGTMRWCQDKRRRPLHGGAHVSNVHRNRPAD